MPNLGDGEGKGCYILLKISHVSNNNVVPLKGYCVCGLVAS